MCYPGSSVGNCGHSGGRPWAVGRKEKGHRNGCPKEAALISNIFLSRGTGNLRTIHRIFSTIFLSLSLYSIMVPCLCSINFPCVEN